MTVLADKVAIITGASSGIGRATAILFAREGAKLVVTARRQVELDALAEDIRGMGGEVIAIAGTSVVKPWRSNWSRPQSIPSAGSTSLSTTPA